MPTYKIGLARTYLITIQAESPEAAQRLSENFVGEVDLSTSTDHLAQKFEIDQIELVDNDVFECGDD